MPSPTDPERGTASRRSFLAGVTTLAAAGALTTAAAAEPTSQGQRFVVRSVEDGPLFQYEFTVTGGATKLTDAGDDAAETNDSVTENADGTVSVTGAVGNGYGDAFTVDGTFTDFSADVASSEYTLHLDGTAVTAADLVGNTGPTLTVADASVTVDESTDVPVVLSAAPDGLAGFELTVSVGDTAVATLTDAVGLPADDGSARGLTDVSVTDDGAASVRVADLGNSVGVGDTDVTLVTVELQGVAEGSTSLSVTVDTLQDEGGTEFTATTSDGTASVSSGLGPVGDSPNPPTDPDGDGTYEDVDGDGDADLDDVIRLNANRDGSTVQNSPAAFDFDGDGDVDLADVLRLLEDI